MKQQLELISHKVENTTIQQRAADGYVNATAMCKATGKLFADYRRLGTTEAFLRELSTVMGIPITGLIVTVQGGSPSNQGTWIHPDAAVHLGQWCSPKFAVAVARWVREWMQGKTSGGNLPYHLRRYVANQDAVPVGHFSVLAELTVALIAPMEKSGYTLKEEMVPDISQGKMFCKWLREVKGVDTDALPTYTHRYEDGREVQAKAYPEDLLADFRRHFREEWMPNRAEKYFAGKDPSALPFLQPILMLYPPAPQSESAKAPVSRKRGADMIREIKKGLQGR